MGMTMVRARLANVLDRARQVDVDMTVDSGAIYSVVPTAVLRKLGIKPISTQEFRLADGSTIKRRKGIALFQYEERIGGADVIFGERGDHTLLGAFTLESLGLALDPLRRELKPIPMILAGNLPLRNSAPRQRAA